MDGTDIREVTRASLRGTYGMVLQDTWLFAGTVRDNIAYGKPAAPLRKLWRRPKAAHADSFIRRLPQGYDTVLAEDGDNLSQGQKSADLHRADYADRSADADSGRGDQQH